MGLKTQFLLGGPLLVVENWWRCQWIMLMPMCQSGSSGIATELDHRRCQECWPISLSVFFIWTLPIVNDSNKGPIEGFDKISSYQKTSLAFNQTKSSKRFWQILYSSEPGNLDILQRRNWEIENLFQVLVLATEGSSWCLQTIFSFPLLSKCSSPQYLAVKRK